MRILTFQYKKMIRLGHLTDHNMIIDLASASHGLLPSDMMSFLERGEYNRLLARKIAANDDFAHLSPSKVKMMAPIPAPPSIRDGYGFKQHVKAGRKARGLEMIPEYDDFPVFYFSNHRATTGPGNINVMKEHLNKLDFELECAVVIGKKCMNVKASEADEYIAGYMIMNDWSARAIQHREMKLNLGPVKGKDFATSFGPYLVTRNELDIYRIPGKKGERYDLEMTAKINGELVSKDNLKNMTWTFAQIIEQASYGTYLYPGDIIGSGTCGSGCLMELNASKKKKRWLNEGDEVELSIEGLGTLTNKIVKIKE
ncbi:MAG: fumarylacetoacetate hydrolase family protein [Fidelibacterota bacterium]